MTPLDIFSLASGMVAVVQHYLPLKRPKRRRSDTEAVYVPFTKPALPPFPAGQSESDVFDRLSAILSHELNQHVGTASTDSDAKVLQQYVDLLSRIQRTRDDFRAFLWWDGPLETS